MSFLWMNSLWLLLSLPLLVAGYVLLLNRKKRAALRYTDLALVKQALGAARWRRHVPPALFLAAVAVALLAMARPQALVTLPSQRSTLILAIDVSGSMRAEERLAAFLLNLSQRFAARGYSSKSFLLRMTRNEIGSYLGLKLETISRALSHFQDEGIIAVQNNSVEIKDADRLRAMVGQCAGHQ